MTARKTAEKAEDASVAAAIAAGEAGVPGVEIPADPGVTGDLADVVTSDPAAHKTWVTLPDGQQGWMKKERKDSLLVVLSIAGFDGETRWVHRDNVQDIRTAD